MYFCFSILMKLMLMFFEKNLGKNVMKEHDPLDAARLPCNLWVREILSIRCRCGRTFKI